MKILATGKTGQVGGEIASAPLNPGWEIIALDSSELDLAKPNAFPAIFDRLQPDAVINAAAYTAVDRAESEADLAYAVNAEGPGALARLCAERDLPLIHVSTDYVFDGSKSGGYCETDEPNPQCVYGASKLSGEQAIAAAGGRHVILRTSWVFSARGNNFVKTMLRLGRERDELGVVDDQYGCPTSAGDIADALLAVTASLNSRTPSGAQGILHFCNSEPTTWYGFAKAIFDMSHLDKRPALKPITTADYPTPAKRPANSVLDCRKIQEVCGIAPRPWKTALAGVLAELEEGGR